MSPAPAEEVDALGLLCPLPIVRLRQAMARVPSGAVVVLWADDEGILEDLPAWCEGSGHALLELSPASAPRGQAAWRGVVRKG